MSERSRILVVDDSPIDRRLAGGILERRGHFAVSYAGDGEEALRAVEAGRPDLVLTDLLMPNLTGLELVERIRAHHPMLPVVLMTAHGSEDTAVAALRSGAASYVPKRNLATDLVATIESILAIAVGERREQEVASARRVLSEEFEIESDPAAMTGLVRHLEDQLTTMGLFDETERIQIAVALREALVNAIYHGNL
jgi:DNA-binding NtrC family response regulator